MMWILIIYRLIIYRVMLKKIKGHADDNTNWFLQDCNKDLKN